MTCRFVSSVDQLCGVVAKYTDIACTGPLCGLGTCDAVVLSCGCVERDSVVLIKILPLHIISSSYFLIP